MATTGKTGADGIARAFHGICRIITRYRVKLDGVIDAAAAASVITSSQATIAHDFVAAAATTCAIFELIAGYSNVEP